MVKRSFGTLLTAAAILATAGLSYAGTAASSSTASLDAAPVDTNPLLMYGLDKIPAGKQSLGQDISNAGFDIYGYMEVGYTANLSGQNHPIPGRVFDTEGGNNIQMDQLDLAVSRSINLSDPGFRKAGWMIGGKAEMLYGYDPGVSDGFHSNGANFYHAYANNGAPGATGVPHPLYQFDPEQFYLSFGIALGKESGLKIRAGKFVTLLGEETINPTTNYFYSHTYEFGYAIPYTETGVMADYMLNSQWSFWGGVTRPENQSLRSAIPSWNFMGAIDYTPASNLSFAINEVFGPNDYYTSAASGDVVGYTGYDRSILDLVASYTPPILNNNLTLVANLDWGYDGGGPNAVSGTGITAAAPAESANWYAASLYQSYVINSYLTFNTREEVYDDQGNMTIGGTLGGSPGGSTVVGDLTAGVTITPMPNSNLGKHLEFRPELREDLCDHPYFNGKHYQTTLAMDAIYQF